MKFSKTYVKKTHSSVQRELGQGHMYNEMLLENKLIASIAALNCRTNTQIHRLQKLMLTAFPDVLNEFLFSEKQGIHVAQSGDVLI